MISGFGVPGAPETIKTTMALSFNNNRYDLGQEALLLQFFLSNTEGTSTKYYLFTLLGKWDFAVIFQTHLLKDEFFICFPALPKNDS